jgi:hypothetical protein
MTPASPDLQTNETEKPQRFSSKELSKAFSELSNRLAASRTAGALERQNSASGFSVFDFIAPSENVLSDIDALRPRGIPAPEPVAPEAGRLGHLDHRLVWVVGTILVLLGILALILFAWLNWT